MSFKLFMCKLGFHKWIYSRRNVRIDDDPFVRDNTQLISIRRCIKCEKIEESVFGYTWNGRNI